MTWMREREEGKEINWKDNEHQTRLISPSPPPFFPHSPMLPIVILDRKQACNGLTEYGIF